jgi:phospholipid/cholesterol/gamma-HCH transport system substrate-binding protein
MKRRDEVLVGITATAAIVGLVIGSLWLARGGIQPGYPLYAKFTWGAGLKQGQPVLLAGVNVGYVDEVTIRQDGLLVVKFRIRRGFKVPLGTTATIQPNGFFGDQLIALNPDKPNPLAYQKGDTILSGHPTPQLGDVLARVDTIAANISVLTKALQKEFVDSGGLADIHKTVSSATGLMAELRHIADEQSAELTKTQQALRRVASAVDSARIDSTIKSISGAASSVTTLASDLRETTAKLNATMAKMTDGDGSLAKLMNNPGMYNDVRGLLQRLDSLTADFKKNPRKYIKLSIF